MAHRCVCAGWMNEPMDGWMHDWRCLDSGIKEPREAVVVRFREAAEAGRRGGKKDPKAGE